MITNLLLGRKTVHQIITHNCTFIYIQFYIYMVTKYHLLYLGSDSDDCCLLLFGGNLDENENRRVQKQGLELLKWPRS